MPRGVDSLLLGSANAIRHAGDSLIALRVLPTYTVGSATAKAAKQAGLDVRFNGSSDLQEALDRLAVDGWRRPLRLCGLQHIMLQQPAGVQIETAVNYESAAHMIAAEHYMLLRKAAVIMVHSARAMAQLEQAVMSGPDDAMTLAKQHKIIAISARAAAKAGLPWSKIEVAPMPTDDDMVKLAEKLCAC